MNAPLNHLTLRERIYQEIVRLIVSGELPGGSAIDGRALTQRLRVSWTPFREALGTLAKEGLIEIQPYRGYFVRSVSPKELKDLYELRKVLECLAVELAMSNVDDGDLVFFEDVLEQSDDALNSGDMNLYGECDKLFHDRIADLSQNSALAETLQRLSLQIQIGRILANRSQAFAHRASHGREEILRAFRERDTKSAVELMRRHISDVQNEVLQVYEAL